MGLLKKLASAALAVSLLVGPAGPAAAAYPSGVAVAARRLQALGLIQGRDSNNPDSLALDDPITRAELVTVIVRAFGLRESAKQLKGVPAFPDSAAHWASGEIAMAKTLIEGNGFTLGMPDGNFSPDAKVTASQAVAFLVKFLGLRFDKKGAWPGAYFDAATNSGMLTASDRAAIIPVAEQMATRGLVFYIMDSAFYNVQLPEGKTVYTKYVKPNPPSLSVSPVPTSSVGEVTVSGLVSKDAISVLVNNVRASVNAQGRYTATVSVDEGGGIIVKATDLAGNVTTQMARKGTLPEGPGMIDAPASVAVQAGEAVDLPVAVRDSQGREVRDVALSITSDLGEYVDGKFKAGLKAGTGVIVITAGDVSQSVSVTVTPAAPARIVVSPDTAQVALAETQTFTATGYDEYGNLIRLPGQVTWSASEGVIDADGHYVASRPASGPVTITAKVGALSGTAQVTVFDTAHRIVLSTDVPPVANGSSHVTLTATVKDADGVTVHNFTGPLTVTTNDSRIISIPAPTTTFVDGTAQVDLYAGTRVATALITATIPGLTPAVLQVRPVAPVPTSLTLSADPNPLSSDTVSKTTVTAVVLDQSGVPMIVAPTGSWTADFATSDPTVLKPATVLGVSMFLDGDTGLFQATAKFTAATPRPGTATVTATLRNNGAAVSQITGTPVEVSTVLVGPPYRLTIDPVRDAKAAGGGVQKVVVRVRDFQGYQVTQSGSDPSSQYPIQDLMLATNTGASAILPPALNNSNAGPWSGGKAVFAVADPKAELVAYTVSGTSNSVPLEKTTATGLFLPGPADHLEITASPNVLSTNGMGEGMLSARLVDASGNVAPEGSFSVTFRRISQPPYAIPDWTDTTVRSAGGLAIVPIRAGLGAGADRFTAEAVLPDGSLRVSDVVLVTTTQAVGTTKQLRWATTQPITAGSRADIQVMIYDEAGILPVSYDNTTNVTLQVMDPSRIQKTYSARVLNGIATFPLTLTKAGNYTLKATSAGLKGASSSADNGPTTQVVNPGPPRHMKATSNIPYMVADRVSTATVTVTMQDDYGNPAPPTSDFNLDGLVLTSSDPNVAAQSGEISFYRFDGVTPTNVPSEKAIAKIIFKAGTFAGPTIITARRSGLEDSAVTVTTRYGNPLVSAVHVEAAGPTMATVDLLDKQFQKITVQLVDEQGTRITNPQGQSYFAGLTATGQSGASQIKMYVSDNPETELKGDNRPQFTQENGCEVTFWVTDDKAETVTYRVSVYPTAGGGVAMDKDIKPATATADFVHNDPFKVVVTATPTPLRGDGTSTAALVAVLTDKNGNPITDATGTIRLQLDGDDSNSHAAIVGADTDGWYAATLTNGQATATVQTKLVTTTADVSVAAEYVPEDPDEPGINTPGTKVLTVGSNLDNTPPLVAGVTVYRAANGAVASGDRFLITFSEKTNAPALKASDFVLPANRTFGSEPAFGWDPTGTVLTIVVGAGVQLAQGDPIKFYAASTVTDLSVNNFGKGILFLVDVVAPVPTVAVNRQVAGQVSQGDQMIITFSEPVKSGPLSNSSFIITDGHDFGTGATFTWDPTMTILTVTTGARSNIAHNDSVAFAPGCGITDKVGNPVKTTSIYRVDLNQVVVSKVTVQRARNMRFLQGDSIFIDFSRATNGPPLTANDFVVSSGHTFGTGAAFTWNADRTTLEIRAGQNPTLTDGDNIRLAKGDKVYDSGGNFLGTGTLVRLDVTAPTIELIQAHRQGEGRFQQGDTIVITFTEETTAPTLTQSSFDIRDGHAFGSGATFRWDAQKKVLTITGGSNPTLMDGDTIAFSGSSTVQDRVGNGFGSEAFLTLDLTSPTVRSVAVHRSRNNELIATDTITLTFSEPTNAPPLQKTDFVISNGHTFGDDPTFEWTLGATVLTITAGNGANVVTGDAIALATGGVLTDLAANPFSGALWTADLAAPRVVGVVVRRAVNNAFAADDTITMTFDKTTTAPDLRQEDFLITGGHNFGDGATFRWDGSGKVLTITGAGIPSLQTGDSVTLVNEPIRDLIGNAIGTEELWKADLTAPAVARADVYPLSGSPNGGFEPNDRIVITLTEPVTGARPELTAADFVVSGGGNFGDDAIIDWGTDNQSLTIHLGGINLNLADGQTISLKPSVGALIRDAVGNPIGGIDLLTVDHTKF